MVKRGFGEEKMLVDFKELAEGFCNVAYELILAGNERVILKIGPQQDIRMMRCERGMMRTEVKAMKLAAQNGIAGVPRVFYYDDSREICSGEYFMMEKLEGEGYYSAKQQLSEKQQNELDTAIGQYLHDLNKIEGKRFGHFCMPEYQSDNWFECFYSMVKDIAEDGISVSVLIGVSYEKVLELLRKHERYFTEVTRETLINTA